MALNQGLVAPLSLFGSTHGACRYLCFWQGFFTALSIQKRNVGNYALNRLIRLGVPILLLWAVIPEIAEGTNDIFKLPELISWLLYDVPFTLRLGPFVVPVLFVDILWRPVVA